jgi:hypothetical protein
MIADSLLAEMVDLGFLRPQSGWQAKRSESYAERLASLHASYYARGMARLDGLRKWTQGKAPKVRPGP